MPVATTSRFSRHTVTKPSPHVYHPQQHVQATYGQIPSAHPFTTPPTQSFAYGRSDGTNLDSSHLRRRDYHGLGPYSSNSGSFNQHMPPFQISSVRDDIDGGASERDVSHLKRLLDVLSASNTQNSHLGASSLMLRDAERVPARPTKIQSKHPLEFKSTSTQNVVLPDISYVLGGVVEHEQRLPAIQWSPNSPCSDRSEPQLSRSLVNGEIFTTDPAVYSTLCEPLSHWIAAYLWKVTTDGMSLSPDFVDSRINLDLPAEPLPVLAESIHSLLLSTLLQPSVIVLSLLYISRLPAYIGPCALDIQPESTLYQFKVALSDVDGITLESPVPKALYISFKLFVIGSILSNKMLDDHVFTLKTWHEVSIIPLHALNKLEWLSLDLLHHDLCVTPSSWVHWLGEIRRFHCALNPNSAKASNGYNLMAHIIDSLSGRPSIAIGPGIHVEPVFLGIEDRVQANLQQEASRGLAKGLDFELDEDGPLREEYKPRRHSGIRSHEVYNPELTAPTSLRWSPSAADSPVSFQHSVSRIAASSSWPPTPLDSLQSPPIYGQACLSCSSNLFSPISPAIIDTHVAFEPLPFSTFGVVNIDDGASTTLCDYYLSCRRMQEQRPTWITA